MNCSRVNVGNVARQFEASLIICIRLRRVYLTLRQGGRLQVRKAQASNFTSPSTSPYLVRSTNLSTSYRVNSLLVSCWSSYTWNPLHRMLHGSYCLKVRSQAYARPLRTTSKLLRPCHSVQTLLLNAFLLNQIGVCD